LSSIQNITEEIGLISGDTEADKLRQLTRTSLSPRRADIRKG